MMSEQLEYNVYVWLSCELVGLRKQTRIVRSGKEDDGVVKAEG
jgi:hypothetical protein